MIENEKRIKGVGKGKETYPRDDKKVLQGFRLSKCPFKVNKKFCSFCKIHCYKPEMRERIKAVMKYSGPRMLFTHPIFAVSHVLQMIKYKKQLKKGEQSLDRQRVIQTDRQK